MSFFSTTLAPRVLLHESDAAVARVLTVLLEHWGYQVEVAHDEASTLVAAVGRAPNVIVIDLLRSAGGGLSLVEALTAARATAEIPIIGIHAPDTSAALAALAAGCSSCQAVPLDTQALFAALSALSP